MMMLRRSLPAILFACLTVMLVALRSEGVIHRATAGGEIRKAVEEAVSVGADGSDRAGETLRAEGRGHAQNHVQDGSTSRGPYRLFQSKVRSAPRGCFPRYLSGEQSFWIGVGVNGDSREALLNTDGAIEVDRPSFLLEPFLFLDGRLITWNDVSAEVTLDDAYLPIPSVTWAGETTAMTIRAFASGGAGRSFLIVTYTIHNTRPGGQRGSLFLAIRPLPFSPPGETARVSGTAGPVRRIESMAGMVIIDDTRRIIPLDAPDGFGAMSSDAGEISDFLRRGTIPASSSARDPRGYASGSFLYSFRLSGGQAREFAFVVPFHEAHPGITVMRGARARDFVRAELDAVRRYWHARLDRVHISLPGGANEIVRTMKSVIAGIFVHRDGPALQSGTRSYERSWIRDGSLMSTALLQMGFSQEVREYIDWYARYQYPSGKIPSVVDSRGADPAPEHSSQGDFISSVLQYFRFTQDTVWLRSKLDPVIRSVLYLQELRQQHASEEYRTGPPDRRILYGLLPESGDRGALPDPVHRYRDNFSGIRGLKDAVALAGILGEDSLVSVWGEELDDCRTAVYASIQLAMVMHQIAYIPGCAERADFDPASVALAVTPGGEIGRIPEPALHNTFSRYYDVLTGSRDGRSEFVDCRGEEMRMIGAFVYLDQKPRAHEALEFFLNERRPQQWNQWPEVIRRHSAIPRFTGEMPHSLAGAEFVRSVRSMLVYEREVDSCLVIGAGIPRSWSTHPDGVEVRSVPTAYGLLGYSMRSAGDRIHIQLGGTIRVPEGRIIVCSPVDLPLRSVSLDGTPHFRFTPVEVMIDRVPADLVLSYTE